MRNMFIGYGRALRASVMLLLLIQTLVWDSAPAQPSVCPGLNYTLRSQAEVDAFPSGCSEVTGNLGIEGFWGPGDITDLSSLSSLTNVGGGLAISDNATLTNLNGLSALTSVRGDLMIRDNASLTHLEGLSALTTVGGAFSIGYNASLTHLEGLSALTTVGGDLSLGSQVWWQESYYTSLDGLSGLTHLGGVLAISRAHALVDLDGLSALTSVGGVHLFDCPELANVDVLYGLSSIQDLRIQSTALPNLDAFSGITSLKYLGIWQNTLLTNLDGLSGLSGSVQWLAITGNPAITNLIALSGLSGSIESGLEIASNAALTNLDGLEGIASVGGSLRIENNPAITNLDGLSGLGWVGGDLVIESNIGLTNCSCGLYSCVSSDCVTGSISMADNASSGDCNNAAADLVINECAAPDAVTLLLPDDGATQVAAYTAFTWQPIEDAAAYHLQVSSDAAFTSSVIDDSTLTEAALVMSAPLAYSSGYFWHVRAALDDGLGKTTGLLFGPWSETRSFTVAVGTATEDGTDLPTAFALHPNYPNPFNPATTITYDVPEAAEVRLTVFDALGRVVQELSTRNQEPGAHAVTWSPRSVPSGVYFVRMGAGPFTQTRRMILTK